MNIKAVALLLTTAITTMVGGEVKAHHNGIHDYKFMAKCSAVHGLRFCGCVDKLVNYASTNSIQTNGVQVARICNARVNQRLIPAYRHYYPRPVHPNFKFKHNPFAGSALQAPSISF